MCESENPCEKKNEDQEICEELVRIFGQNNVDVEWSVCKDATDDMKGSEGEKERYCPKIDFIVGPLNITKDEPALTNTREYYDSLYVSYKGLFDRLYKRDREIEKEVAKSLSKNEQKCQELLDVERESHLVLNSNPRCFLAIEIEKETGRKHILGGIVNASGLGKVGIILTLDDEEKYRTAMKIRRYLRFLVAVKKLGEYVTLAKNTILLPRGEFLRIMREHPHLQC